MLGTVATKFPKGMVALITGAASCLGKATAERLVDQGAKVVIFDLPVSKGQEVASSLDCLYVPGDVTSEKDVGSALQQIQEKFGRLDVAVNCAAQHSAHMLYNFNKDTTHNLEDFTRILMVNCVGTFNVIRLCVEMMIRNMPDINGQRGVLITTSSMLAFQGQLCQSALSASSGAIASMTLPIARDLASACIRCCCIAPGTFKGPLTDFMPQDIIDFLSQATPYPSRLGDPSEFAHLVQAIIENPMMNGEVVRLNGGQRLVI